MDPEHDDRAWVLGSTGAIVGVITVAFLLGFVLVPIVQGRQAGIDPWTAFCRALGLLPGTPAAVQPVSTARAEPVSEVAWTPEILRALSQPRTAPGAELAKAVCSACHGERGVSPSPQFPHLSGQSAAAIYKQLHDYQSGARVNAMMKGVVQNLTEEQMVAVAIHFAGGNSFASLGRARPIAEYEMDRLANRGAPDRGVPACNACHGAHVGGPIETPTLVGQHREYLEAQLHLYASGARRNDIYGRMRSVARRLTREEIHSIAAHYAGLPPPQLADATAR